MARSKAGPKAKARGKRARAQKGAFTASGPSCMMPGPTTKVYNFERTLYQGPMIVGTVDKGWSFSFTLGNFPGATEFTQLFDLYRMKSLEITFSLIGVQLISPTLCFMADYDSFTTPTSLDAVAQRPHKRVTLSASQPTFTFKLKPRVMLVSQTSSGVGSAALAPASQWLDCNDSTVVYGGLLGWILQFNSVSNNTIATTVRATFDMAMVR